MFAYCQANLLAEHEILKRLVVWETSKQGHIVELSHVRWVDNVGQYCQAFKKIISGVSKQGLNVCKRIPWL